VAETYLRVTLGVQPSQPAPTFSPLSVNPSALHFDIASTKSGAIAVNPGSADLSWNTLVTYPQLPNGWLTVTPARGTGPASVQLAVDSSALIPGSVYTADLIVQSLNSTPQFADIPITVTMPSSGASLVNGASFALGSAPGAAISIFAPSMKFAGKPEQAASLPLPPAIQGLTVTVNNIPAPLYYVSPNQVNAQIPYEVPPGPATLTVQNGEGQVATEQIYLNTVAPGIFLGSDGTHLAPDVSVRAGGYASLFLTGQGIVTPAVVTGYAPPNPSQVPVSGLPRPMANVAVYVNGVQAQTSFVGVPYYLTGVTQVNFIVPKETLAGDQQVTLVVGKTQSNTAYMRVTR